MFSGVGTLSQALRASGLSTCSLDIVDWNPWIQARMLQPNKRMCKGNPLDLTTQVDLRPLYNVAVFPLWFLYVYIYIYV